MHHSAPFTHMARNCASPLWSSHSHSPSHQLWQSRCNAPPCGIQRPQPRWLLWHRGHVLQQAGRVLQLSEPPSGDMRGRKVAQACASHEIHEELGEWVISEFSHPLLTNHTNPQKKLSNDPPESQVTHSSNLHQEVRAERGFLRRMRPSILWFSLNWFPKNYEPNAIPRFLGRCLLLGPARGGYQLEFLVVRAVSDHWIEAVLPLQSTHTARDTLHLHVTHTYQPLFPETWFFYREIIHRSIKSSFRRHYVLALTPAIKYTYQKILKKHNFTMMIEWIILWYIMIINHIMFL